MCSYCNCTVDKSKCTQTVSGNPATSSVTCSPNLTSTDCLPGFYLDGQSCLPCKSTSGNITGNETCCGLGLIYTSGPPISCNA